MFTFGIERNTVSDIYVSEVTGSINVQNACKRMACNATASWQCVQKSTSLYYIEIPV